MCGGPQKIKMCGGSPKKTCGGGEVTGKNMRGGGGLKK